MFNYLFNKYKLEILGESFWASFKKCKRYEQISISLICIGPVLAALLLFFRVYIISLISFALCLVGLLNVESSLMQSSYSEYNCACNETHSNNINKTRNDLFICFLSLSLKWCYIKGM